jgi:hypothetical protein
MKVAYSTLDPLRHPRVRKIAYSFRKRGDIKFQVMIPKRNVICVSQLFGHSLNIEMGTS